jgi:hypothetical protein
MHTLVRTLLAVILIIGICNPAQAQKKRKSNPHAPGEDIYKHYRGTIGNRAVVFDVIWGWQGGSNYGGSYFYYTEQPETKHFIISEPPTFEHNETLWCNVTPEHTPPGENFFSDRDRPHERMTFTITDNKLEGKWYSPSEKDSAQINLTEDNSNAALEIRYYYDTVSFTNSKNNRFKVAYSLLAVQTNEGDANRLFITSSMMKFLSKGKPAGNDMNSYLAKVSTEYFSKLKANKDAIPADIAVTEKRKYASLSAYEQLLPIYNDKGFLVLKKTLMAQKADGGFKDELCSYLCLDLNRQKAITFDDVFNGDDNSLSNKLKAAYIRRYDMPPSKNTSTLKVNKIPVTKNIALVHKGINFSYDHEQLLKPDKEAFGLSEVNIFIPYTDLKDLLKPEFKKRIGM